MSLSKDINSIKKLFEDNKLFKPASGDDIRSNQIEHDYVCDECGRPATMNIQDLRHCWKILPDGDMEEVGEAGTTDTNLYYCTSCGEKHGWRVDF